MNYILLSCAKKIKTGNPFNLISIFRNAVTREAIEITAAINAIEDEKQRKIINIEFNNSQTFERFSDSVLFMCSLVGLEETRVNELWEYGMRL